MKPSVLRPLIGRKVEVYWNGARIGQVLKIPKTSTLLVEFPRPHGRHRIELEKLVGVYWRGRKIDLETYLKAREAELLRGAVRRVKARRDALQAPTAELPQAPSPEVLP